LAPESGEDARPPSPRPRVLFVSPVADFKGGAERVLFDVMANPAAMPVLLVPAEGPLSESAHERGIACDVLPLGHVHDVRRPFDFAQVGGAMRDTVRSALSLRRLARARSAILVHSNGLKTHVVACLARLLGGPALIVHLHDIPFTRAEKLVWRLLALCADHVVVVSRACWPWPSLPRNVRVVHNGFRSGEHRPGPSAVGSPIRLGYIGRVTRWKGLDVLLDWLAEARDCAIGCELRVRSGSSEPDFEAEIWRTMAASNLVDHVHFDGFRSKLPDVYDGLDIVVVPSTMPDPLPRVVMEAWSLGIPVIAYPSGGIPELIVDRKTGYLVTSADGFVNALRELSDPERYRAVASAACLALRERFGIDAMYAALSTIYDDALAR
jgi:glycosyltransferase involved in cell wall biosynthesis